MPDSFALNSICRLLMRIRVTAVRMEKATVTMMMISDGITSIGAKLKICVTYKREDSEVSPVLSTMPIRIEHNEFTDMARLFNSPALY